MYSTDLLLNKINQTRDSQVMTLADLQPFSFHELRSMFEQQLSWGEAHYLYREAAEQKKRNRLLEARIFTRTNPQLSAAVRLGIEQDSASRSYDEMFGSRSSSFVKPGSVASMFSPAGYLTELYREAKDLHFTSSAYHLDNRRPDLADLTLSQNNMDTEISTLTLSNELLLEHITRKTGRNSDALMESLSTYRQAIDTPYHQPYETVRQVIMSHDSTLSALSRNPEVMGQAEGASLLAILANISPELYDILTEEITEENADDLFAKNFSENVTPENFASQSWIGKHYGLELSEVQKYLGMLQNGYSDSASAYVDNISTGLVINNESKLEAYKITRVKTDDYDKHVNYFDLMYEGNNQFFIRANFKVSREFGATLRKNSGTSGIVGNLAGPLIANTSFKSNYLTNISDSEYKNGVKIYAYRYTSSSYAENQGGGIFTFESYPLTIFALKLNKAIRLCLASGLSPNELQTIVRSDNAQGVINDSVLTKVFHTLFYSNRYTLSVDDAQVLNGSVINQYADDDRASHFNRIFNTPPLKGKIFEADGSTVSIDPGEGQATFARSALMRGLGVNSGELYQLGKLAGVLDSQNNITLSVSVISSLYRLTLLSRSHHLTVNELGMLYGFSPFNGKTTASLSAGELSRLVIWFYQVTQWLTEAEITTEMLWLLCTPEVSGNISPEISNLLNTLRPRLSEDIAQSNNRELQAEILAPFIAATLHLASPDMARYILLWTDNLRPGSLDIAGFITLVLRESLNASETAQLVQFCHVMAQLSLSVQTLRLSEAELSVLVISGFAVLGAKGQPAGQHNIDTLFSLYRFHQWINGLGNPGSDTLDMLRQQTLAADRLAAVMGLDISMVTQAMVSAGVNRLQCWQDINTVLQWIDVASELHTMPSVIRTLVNIRYVTEPSKTVPELPSWDEWQTLAENMAAGLSTQQAQALEDYTAERLSSVLCNWFLANIQPEGVSLQSRDDLYSYFLIDNQVSSAVRTTRLAEAIAGIQLYINRALNRIEPNARADVSTRQFFTDWTVNNRYSTWGGVSRLVYYPENYIDPTQRIGQTRMMDELLENISQSQLSRDTVEEAFKTYLTRFETVADLKVVSAYHDNVNSNTGLTWFVGQTRENLPEYYWRNVDISRMQAGKLAANAWKEWTKIDTAVNPYRDAIRPVIFRERLHLIWVEKDEVAENGTDPVKTYDRFTLKLAFLRHDGSWSAPWSYDITTQVTAVTGNNPDAERLGLAASGFQGEDTLLVFVYKTGKDYNDFGGNNKNVAGMTIYGDGSLRKMENTVLSRYSQLKNTFDVINPQNNDNTQDKDFVRKAGYRFAQDFEIPTSLNMGSATGTYNLTVMEKGNIPQITSKYSSDDLVITLHNAAFTVRYDGSGNATRNKQIKAMKLTGVDGKSQYGNAFIIANTFKRYGGYLDLGGPVTVYNKTKNYIASVQDRLMNSNYIRRLILTPVENNYYARLFEFSFSPNTILNTVFMVGSNKANEFKKCSYAVDGNNFEGFQIFCSYQSSGWLDIDTSIDNANVKITVVAGSKSHTFTASGYVDDLPANSFDAMPYTFKPLEIDASSLVFTNNIAPLEIIFEARAKDGRVLGKINNTLSVKRVNYNPDDILLLRETRSGAQYMQLGVYRIRLNTLLAPQLVSRANTGIDTILTMETQRLPEPQLGEGFFANFILPKYDPAEHGDERWFKIHIGNIGGNSGRQPYYSGMLSDESETGITLFVPYAEGYYMHEGVRLGVGYKKITYDGSWESAFFYFDKKEKQFVFINDADYATGMTNIGVVDNIKKYKGFVNVSIATGYSAPMDFNSASALYYWELFYYTPMMCFQRLLQEKQFDEATKWMNYIYNPAGYIVNGEIAPWTWNCRPLEETTSWNANPLDVIDPDAVAQNDPTHYKVATFMRLLDQLILRGDMAYRELTRDALNEAKMWYVRALELLGDEPEDYGSSEWAAPSLSVAASQTVQVAYQQDLTMLGRGGVPKNLRTANSLVGLFLPEYNPALTDYWKTLRLRLFNLRHNLSIDGQPLSLAIYAEPTDPKALLTSMVQASQGGSAVLPGTLSLYRFPVMLERARNLVAQLTQFGTSLLSMAEHDDADELTTLLLKQGMELATQSIRIQQRTVDEVDADIAVLAESRRSAQNRLDKYQRLYDEDINHGEQRAMALLDAAAGQSLAGQALSIAEGVADLVPNVFGFATGGSRWGAALRASASVLSLSAAASQSSAEKISRSETYRRRRQEWEIQRDNADGEVKQMDAQLEALKIRRESAQMQVEYQETQQAHTQAQLELLQRKFTNKALYSWMRGKLSAIYYQFFDLTQSFSLMAQEALRRELNDSGVTFIRGDAWNGTTAGLMAGETLSLNLAEMEKAWLERDERALEVTRTVSLAQFYQALSSDNFNLAEKLTQFLREGKGNAGSSGNELKLSNRQIEASMRLSDLNIFSDYPESLGTTRQLKQVSVTLPALVGPYEDIRAVLNYGGSIVMPRGCSAIALSHGVNDSGQFVLDFNDTRYLPFEGIPVNDNGSLTLSFPDSTDRQKALLESLSDIILHIRYTIRS
ncbi:toxin [Xenorhabdus sp. 42]|uniref:Tc toxin subunit A-related protein n=1 Tax=Xenorhabdus szentirmaii TaxID=290112 RepID=UPI0019A19A9F|nr:neuraminidase-like domain-containing protein [Xenorhabdus sp. 42]MBD2820060.1 toxin [Xenorhabdus sp. 42]